MHECQEEPCCSTPFSVAVVKFAVVVAPAVMAVDEGFKGRGHGQCEPCTKWSIVRKAVQQHRILGYFHTLRHMSDGLLLDFDKLQYVCTLGGAHASPY